MNKILPAVVVLFALFALWSYSHRKVSEPLQTPLQISEDGLVITLTEDGFSPSEARMKVGETVIFKTTTGKMFWPASNAHPSHGIYPEFDPLQPVSPEAQWSFSPQKAGEWRYHDHLAPYYTGTLIVE